MSMWQRTFFFTLVMIIWASSYSSVSHLFLVYINLSLTETIPYPQLSRSLRTDPRMDFQGECHSEQEHYIHSTSPLQNSECPVCLSHPPCSQEYKTVKFHKRAGPESKAQYDILQRLCAIFFSKTSYCNLFKGFFFRYYFNKEGSECS